MRFQLCKREKIHKSHVFLSLSHLLLLKNNFQVFIINYLNVIKINIIIVVECTGPVIKRIHLFGPSMGTILIGAYIIQSHFFFSSAGLGLEKYRLPMATFGASMVFRSWQRWVRYYVWYNMCQLAKKYQK